MSNSTLRFSLWPNMLSYWQHRDLIITLAKREILGRYKGSAFGLLWPFLSPLLLLTVFTFVFGEIFQAKWAGSDRAGGVDFAAAMFAGYLIYLFFSECVGRAPSIILSNVNYVKKVRFPIDLLAIVTMIAALFHFLAAYLILVILILVSNWTLSWTALIAPLVFFPLILLVLGLTWALSAISVFLRDISQLVVPILTALLFLSPIFYPLSSVSGKLLIIYQLNPLTFIIEAMRGVLLHHQLPDWGALGIYALVSLAIMLMGHALFQISRRGFADVL